MAYSATFNALLNLYKWKRITKAGVAAMVGKPGGITAAEYTIITGEEYPEE